jgi:hypothetical protein
MLWMAECREQQEARRRVGDQTFFVSRLPLCLKSIWMSYVWWGVRLIGDRGEKSKSSSTYLRFLTMAGNQVGQQSLVIIRD